MIGSSSLAAYPWASTPLADCSFLYKPVSLRNIMVKRVCCSQGCIQRLPLASYRWLRLNTMDPASFASSSNGSLFVGLLCQSTMIQEMRAKKKALVVSSDGELKVTTAEKAEAEKKAEAAEHAEAEKKAEGANSAMMPVAIGAANEVAKTAEAEKDEAEKAEFPLLPNRQQWELMKAMKAMSEEEQSDESYAGDTNGLTEQQKKNKRNMTQKAWRAMKAMKAMSEKADAEKAGGRLMKAMKSKKSLTEAQKKKKRSMAQKAWRARKPKLADWRVTTRKMKKENVKAVAMKAKSKAAAPKAVTEKALQARAAAPDQVAKAMKAAPMTPAHIEAMKAGKAFCKCCQASVCDGLCEMHKDINWTCEFCEDQHGEEFGLAQKMTKANA